MAGFSRGELAALICGIAAGAMLLIVIALVIIKYACMGKKKPAARAVRENGSPRRTKTVEETVAPRASTNPAENRVMSEPGSAAPGSVVHHSPARSNINEMRDHPSNPFDQIPDEEQEFTDILV
eukprot:Rhum_TRINITY_DN15065_c26_g1::Rhum_TRINITY_DN15065_c26_g1_i1::g.137513::m.137513